MAQPDPEGSWVEYRIQAPYCKDTCVLERVRRTATKMIPKLMDLG